MQMPSMATQNYARPSMRSPMNQRSPIASRSPVRSAYSQQTTQLTDFPMLEEHGITADDFRRERGVNSEMLRMARNQLEIARLLRNTLAMVRREVPGSYNMVQQASIKADAIRLEVQDSKRRIRENHAVNI